MTNIHILVGSVYGGALLTARRIRDELSTDQRPIIVHEDPELTSVTETAGPILVCTSTTGQGEVPGNLQPLYHALRETLPLQNGRPFGMIVLGDSSYGDTFCGAGDLMEEALLEVACSKVGDTLRIDAMETMDPEEEALPWVREWLEQV